MQLIHATFIDYLMMILRHQTPIFRICVEEMQDKNYKSHNFIKAKVRDTSPNIKNKVIQSQSEAPRLYRWQLYKKWDWLEKLRSWETFLTSF